MSLPNLPIPEALGVWGYARPTSYTAEQLQAYGQQCRDAALEEAAQVCESENQGWHCNAAAVAATKIRSLK